MNPEQEFIGVVCGLKSEAAVVRNALGDDTRVRIGVSGANAQRAEAIAREFSADGALAILSIGVSGGLDPALMSGALVVGEKTVVGNGEAWSSDERLLGASSKTLSNIKTGVLFGADDIIDSAEAKAILFQKYRAIAVDMESHGCAKAAAEASVPFLAIRAIADPADRALPPAALGAIAPDGSTRVFKTLGAALGDPKQFPVLMKLGADSAAATKTLRRDLGPLFRSLFVSLQL